MYVTRVMSSAGRELGHVVRADTPTHGRLRDQITAVVLATIGIDLFCAVLALIFERGASQSQIDSFGSALFWTSTQLLTVSSSIQNPISLAGRILDVAMEAYAITVVAALAGSIGSFMVKRGQELEQAADADKSAKQPARS
jgi:hypothetical protein